VDAPVTARSLSAICLLWSFSTVFAHAEALAATARCFEGLGEPLDRWRPVCGLLFLYSRLGAVELLDRSRATGFQPPVARSGVCWRMPRVALGGDQRINDRCNWQNSRLRLMTWQAQRDAWQAMAQARIRPAPAPTSVAVGGAFALLDDGGILCFGI